MLLKRHGHFPLPFLKNQIRELDEATQYVSTFIKQPLAHSMANHDDRSRIKMPINYYQQPLKAF